MRRRMGRLSRRNPWSDGLAPPTRMPGRTFAWASRIRLATGSNATRGTLTGGSAEIAGRGLR